MNQMKKTKFADIVTEMKIDIKVTRLGNKPIMLYDEVNGARYEIQK